MIDAETVAAEAAANAKPAAPARGQQSLEDEQRIKDAIVNAKTLPEAEYLGQMLASGLIPGKAAAATPGKENSTTPIVAVVEEEMETGDE